MVDLLKDQNFVPNIKVNKLFQHPTLFCVTWIYFNCYIYGDLTNLGNQWILFYFIICAFELNILEAILLNGCFLVGH
jgi:hypothetical protein